MDLPFFFKGGFADGSGKGREQESCYRDHKPMAGAMGAISSLATLLDF